MPPGGTACQAFAHSDKLIAFIFDRPLLGRPLDPVMGQALRVPLPALPACGEGREGDGFGRTRRGR
jgi:hypothetical protein